VRSVVVGTAGHIDHGKSALVRALTGTDPDRLKEEKARGITIDLGFAHLAHDGVNFAFVDVPGHERFVRHMLAGVGGIDFVVLVVAADESVMPQTREHFEICRLLQVGGGIVALTKADLVDADTMEVSRLEVQELVKGSFLEDAPIVAVSSRTGEGLAELREALGRCAAAVRPRVASIAVRLPIDRVFSMRGFGTVITGTLASGVLSIDDELRIEPGGVAVSVRGVQVHGARRDRARAGERVAVNLANVEVGQIERGQTLVSPRAFEPTRVIDVVVDVLPAAPVLKHGARVRFHQGTAEVLARAAVIGRGGGEGAVPKVGAGARGLVRLRLERPVVVTRGDRYILRTYSPATTIAGGWVIDPNPPRGGVRSPATWSRCATLAATAPGSAGDEAAAEASRLMVAGAGRSGFPVAALVSRAGIDPSQLDTCLGRLLETNAAIAVDEVLVAPDVLCDLKTAVLARVREHHATAPLSEGLPREEVRERLFRRGHPAIFARAIAELIADGTLAGRDRLMLATHKVVLSTEEELARSVVEAALRDAALTPPDAFAVAAHAGISRAVTDRVVHLLQRNRRIVKVGDLLFHEEALQALKQRVQALKTAGGENAIDVATFKERFGVTRKFAIPLLEYLDRERVTRRIGDRRLIL
jgi:selenocysteine-specific elongation factor